MRRTRRRGSLLWIALVVLFIAGIGALAVMTVSRSQMADAERGSFGPITPHRTLTSNGRNWDVRFSGRGWDDVRYFAEYNGTLWRMELSAGANFASFRAAPVDPEGSGSTGCRSSARRRWPRGAAGR